MIVDWLPELRVGGVAMLAWRYIVAAVCLDRGRLLSSGTGKIKQTHDFFEQEKSMTVTTSISTFAPRT